MNHDVISSALCGRYTRLSESSGYLESIFPARNDGSLIGAYIVKRPGGVLLITDDGDTLFSAAASMAKITPSRLKSYRKIAKFHGADLSGDGHILLETEQEYLPAAMSNYFRATLAISDMASTHRPSSSERFLSTIGADLARFGGRLKPRPKITGLSGHQLSFHFGIDVDRDTPIMIQALAASDGTLKWDDVYEAGGKFKDAKAARRDLRLVAVLENAEDVGAGSAFLSDLADVYVYRGEPLPIAA